MSRANLPSLFNQESEASSQSQIFHLVTISEITGEADLCLVDGNYDVDYAGITYLRFPLKYSGATMSSDGTIDKASITVSNVSRDLMGFIEKYKGLRGARVSVITTYEKFLDFTYTISNTGDVLVTSNAEYADPDAHIEDEFYIDSYVATEQTISFQLVAVIDFEIKVPRRKFTPFSCYWQFGDPTTCGYSASAAAKASLYIQTKKGSSTFNFLESNLVKPKVGYTIQQLAQTTSWSYPVYKIIAYDPVTRIATIDGTFDVYWLNEGSTRVVLLGVYMKNPATENASVTCKKDISDCMLFGNQARFGGFPGVPTSTRRLYM